MVNAVLSAVIMTAVVLVTLRVFPAVATRGHLKNQESSTLSSLSAKRSDVLLVTDKHWKEQHAVFLRLFEGTVTTWSLANTGLHSYILKNRIEGRRTVVVDVDPLSHLERMFHTLNSKGLRRMCVSWLYVMFKHVNRPRQIDSSSRLTACQVAGILQMNGTFIQSIVLPLTSSVSHNPSMEEIRSKLRIESPNEKRLSGQRLTVGCLIGRYYGGGNHSCDHKIIEFFLGCLRQTNISLNILYTPMLGSGQREFVYNNWDIVFLSTRLKEENVLDADIPHNAFIHETFYSRINDDRVIMLSEVVYGSWPLFASTLALLLVAALVLAKIEDRQLPTYQRMADTVTLLLAAVLATSVPLLGPISRRAVIAVALYFLWFPSDTPSVLVLPQ
ncbi:hypothetical protein MRX96_020587 [Rhipicephalus microplus]